MLPDSSQIRTCLSCGLRYPLIDAKTFGTRCPACLGETNLTLRFGRKPGTEPKPSLNPNYCPSSRRKLAVLLDNIRSAWNVGSVFRSADGFGFTHAYLCGITPTPEREAVTKTSLGAEDSVTWSYHKDAVKLVTGLKKEGWQVWALEEHERAVSLSTFPDDQSSIPVILIIGNEVTGVDPELLDLSDSIFHIPMYGEKTSFNVAVAFGIAAYRLTVLSS
jgi:23S rRNA (guanosine2251-2'-O)-methyltransferase